MKWLASVVLMMLVGSLAFSAGPPRKARKGKSHLRFSHSLHKGLEQGCDTCHEAKQKDELTRARPRGETCLPCHQSLIESRRCDACHRSKADGRLLLDVAGGRLIPRGGHSGFDHDLGWEKSHGRKARTRQVECRVCHTQSSCDECHRGVQRQMHMHPADWELLHATRAKGDADRCTRCHRTQGDCLRCHRRTKVAASAKSRPHNLRPHPKDYGRGALHGQQARRNIKSCTACHAESDCIRCHSANSATSISPHPRGFRRRCKLMKRRNSRACEKCHDRQGLEQRCP